MRAPLEHQQSWRAELRAAATVAAGFLTWLALVAPDRRADLSAASLLRIPIEGLVIIALFLALPRRAARATAVLAGVLLGVVTDLKLINGGFYETLDRPAHLVTDWPLIGSAMDYVTVTYSRAAAIGLAAVVAIALIVVIALMSVSALRINTVARRHRIGAARPLSVLAIAWAICAVLGVQFAAQPVAAFSSAALAFNQVTQIRADLHDHTVFAQQLRDDRFRSSPGAQLLRGLRGKDIVLAFVESYGRSAVQDPAISPGVNAVLATGTQSLAAAGFRARSAFLTSPTAGGGSWLAHSTLLSGTWVSSPARYSDLLGSTRTTLISDFDRAGWQTMATMPATFKDWPEGSFYGYQRIDTGKALEYRGPHFGWSPMPDQFTLSWVKDHDLTPPHSKPVMVEVEMTSSHHPWAPLPTAINWSAVGDGSVYDPMPARSLQKTEVWKSTAQVRAQYGLSIQYSLETLISFLKNYGTTGTVLVFLGDHQPAPVVTGAHASRDVPITIVAHDPAVLNQISSWGWQDGLRPAPNAPVWTMDTFRDRFLTAFSSGTP